MQQEASLADATQAATPVALVCRDREQFGTLMRLLRRSVGKVAVLSSIEQLDPGDDYALVAVNYDDLTFDERDRLVASFPDGTDALLLLSRRLEPYDLATLFGARMLTHMLVIGQDGFDLADLLVTLQKIRDRRIFGLERYFVWGVEPHRLSLTSSAEKADVIDRIHDHATELGIARRLRGAIRSVADEFLSNALYNAPVDALGVPRFASLPRTEPVRLDPGERIEVAFCCDGRRFGLSTTDPFGSLTADRIQQSLARAFRGGADQIRQTPGGAGLGFYQILDALSHFVVNISPGVQTEMIGMLEVSGGYRRFAGAGKSLNIHVLEVTP